MNSKSQEVDKEWCYGRMDLPVELECNRCPHAVKCWKKTFGEYQIADT